MNDELEHQGTQNQYGWLMESEYDPAVDNPYDGPLPTYVITINGKPMSASHVRLLLNRLEADIINRQNKIEALQNALDQTDHFIVFTDDGWSIEHLVSCRPDMTSCPIHKQAQVKFGNEDQGLRGRFKVSSSEDGQLKLKEVNQVLGKHDETEIDQDDE